MFDCNALLRPSSFMDIAQELAAKGSGQLGIPDRVLAQYGLVWILARMRVDFLKTPRRLDSVSARTWHRGAESLFYIRDY